MSTAKTQITKYTVGLSLVTIIVGAAGYFILNNVLQSDVIKVFPFMVLFVFAVTLGIHVLLAKAVGRRPQEFVNRFMLASSAKLFIYLTTMLVYAFLNKEKSVPFILTFFVLYIIYTVYDVVTSNKFFRKS